ncbi:MAG: hypothetical protein Q4D64_07115 [Prevotellaceae bacterium]|nr:hypothetical protein [Prevotellaceae bacterium]
MTLSLSERKIIVDLELEKAHKIYSQIEVLDYDVSKDDILPMIQPVRELIELISRRLKSI